MRSKWHVTPDETIQEVMCWLGLNAYGFDTQYQNQILKETGQNHRYIRARRNSYDHENSIDKNYLRR